MMPTSTGTGFALASLGLAFYAIRFYGVFKSMGGVRTGRKIGVLLSLLFTTFALQLAILAAGLFFLFGTPIFFFLLVINHFFLAVLAALGLYILFYIFFPAVSPWPGVIAAFCIGIAVVVLTVVTHPIPSMDANGGVDWNFSPWLDRALSYLLFIDIGTILIIFAHVFLHTKSREVKILSLIQAGLACLGIINIALRFLFPSETVPAFLRVRIFDTVLGLIGLIYIAIFLLEPFILRLLLRVKK